MSHLTLAGRKCKVGDKKEKCVFHGRRPKGRHFIRGRKSEDQLLDEQFERRLPGALGAPRGRRIRKNRSVEDIHTGRRKYQRPLERYIPRFDSIRQGAGASSRTRGTSVPRGRGRRAWWKRALDEIPGPTGRRAGDWRAVIEDFMQYAGLR